ncbi:LysM domain-containing protein [Geobacter pelophilus]|uniref:LysM domain-containing protein n=1 Tax=Geoanaerobacter pelophilus TaxID=60036 RepID=A0AAW4LCA1_9BACT|nr:LysM peptidoglycan-binding domain-containing protein [Geoanaerobacter pelophilus]MBT0665497.1 LysM domain-containing protein [Geoanaerobacter pelophilus]
MFFIKWSSLLLVFPAVLLSALCLPALAIDPRFDLDTRMLDSRFAGGADAASSQKAKKHKPGRAAARSSRYTIKPGDNLYLILMGKYGLSEKQADAVIPRLKELNGISDIRSLRVGSTISIPLPVTGGSTAKKAVLHRRKEDAPAVVQQFSMLRQLRTEGAADLRFVRGVWDHLFPGKWDRTEGITVSGQNFELALDPDRYPVLPAADGGRILLDPSGNLPPLVKSLVQTLDDVRVVSEDPSNARKFYASLLAEARFFSVSENYGIDFGHEPQLTVTSDFKVEKSRESLMQQGIVLLNVTEKRGGTPPSLVAFLAGQGFRLIEPYSAHRRTPPEQGHRLVRIAGAGPLDIADRVMASQDLKYSRDTRVELFGPNDSGLRLDITADRFFESRGERFIVSRFNGDPVFYTLMRLLETRGYRVIILEEHDDFRRVTEKLLTRMRVPAQFDRQPLWPARDLPYSITFPGFLIRDPASGKKTVLTASPVDPLINELVTLNGFTVIDP